MFFKKCYLRQDDVISSVAKKLFSDVVEGSRAFFTSHEYEQTTLEHMLDTIKVSEDEDGLNFEFGDIVLEFTSGRFLSFTTSEWSRINLVPLTIIEKV